MQLKKNDSGATSLGHIPDGRWAFDESVTAVFGDMLSRSIPQYELMRQTVFDLGAPFVKDHTAVVDLGCSRGDALAPFVDRFQNNNEFVGVDVSEPMLNAARRRFTSEVSRGFVRIQALDLRYDYPRIPSSLTLCILTLQFTPLEYRQRILAEAYANLVDGGAFILIEKVLGASAHLNERMLDLYHLMKRRAGYTAEEVERKRLALEGVLVPITAQWNEQLLRGAGFGELDCFWRWMNFAGWMAIK